MVRHRPVFFLDCDEGVQEPNYSHSIFYANMVFVLAYLGIQGFQDIKTDESGNFFDKKFIVAILQLVMVIETLVVNKYVSTKLGQPFDLSCTSEIIVNGGAAYRVLRYCMDKEISRRGTKIMEAIEYQVWYWYIHKSMRYEFSDKKMATNSLNAHTVANPDPLK